MELLSVWRKGKNIINFVSTQLNVLSIYVKNEVGYR